jgi:hypothetical protein
MKASACPVWVDTANGHNHFTGLARKVLLMGRRAGGLSMNGEPSIPKARKRSSAKTTSRQSEEKVKVTLYVSADLAKRFAVHATYTDMDRSALFAEMIREHCKRFVVSDRAKPQEDSTEMCEVEAE